MLSNNAKTVSYGRGRARSTSKDIEVPLRRPGENVLCKNNESLCDDIITIINNLTINDSLKSSNEICHLLKDIEDKETLNAINDGLYARSLEDKAFGTKLARLFSDKSLCVIHYDKDKSIKCLLLNYLQKNYERREDVKKKNEVLFRTNVSLLGEINCLHPLIVMKRALIDYFNMLLETATEEDIEVITTQVIINGKNLCEDSLKELNTFILNVKKTLVNNTLSTSSKRMLLLIIDLANQNFNSLPKDLYDYYTSNLSTKIWMHFQKQQEDLVHTTQNLKPSKNHRRNNRKNHQKKLSKANDALLVDQEQEAAVAEENYISSDSTVTHPDKTNFTRENSAPRAIRGPGASNADKSSKTRSNSFTSPLSFSTKNKGWGHDDRFENDYE